MESDNPSNLLYTCTAFGAVRAWSSSSSISARARALRKTFRAGFRRGSFDEAARVPANQAARASSRQIRCSSRAARAQLSHDKRVLIALSPFLCRCYSAIRRRRCRTSFSVVLPRRLTRRYRCSIPRKRGAGLRLIVGNRSVQHFSCEPN